LYYALPNSEQDIHVVESLNCSSLSAGGRERVSKPSEQEQKDINNYFYNRKKAKQLKIALWSSHKPALSLHPLLAAERF